MLVSLGWLALRGPGIPEVSTPSNRQPGGQYVLGRVPVSVVPVPTGDTPEVRLALARFRSDMAAGRACLRRVRSGDAQNSAAVLSSVPVQCQCQLAPRLVHDRARSDSHRSRGYTTSEGVPQELLSQFPILEEALEAIGVMVWPMVHYEADDALASAAGKASQDDSVKQVIICTPDKDLSQCVVGTRVVQLDRRRDMLRDEVGVVAKFGVSPQSIPDYLALVGDTADGFPGLSGWGKKAAALTLSQYRHLEDIPKEWRAWHPSIRRAGPLSESLFNAWKRRPVVSHARDLAAGCSRL